MFKNSKKQGDWGVGVAIGYFAKLGYCVLVPLTDSQDYDLAVNYGDGAIKKVQLKTGISFSTNNTPIIGLRTIGGNRTGTGKIKRVRDTNIDLLFCCHSTAGNYLIPINELKVGSTLVLNKSLDLYKLS
jgi:hypothetical protein